MKKTVHLFGFWFHIQFNGYIGTDQRGDTWTNPNDPQPNETLINRIIDAVTYVNK